MTRNMRILFYIVVMVAISVEMGGMEDKKSRLFPATFSEKAMMNSPQYLNRSPDVPQKKIGVGFLCCVAVAALIAKRLKPRPVSYKDHSNSRMSV